MLHSILAAHLEIMSDLAKSTGRIGKDFVYVYAGISRRAGGVSIGINLSPDKICNFNCVYCEVDRGIPPRVREVRLDVFEAELRSMLKLWQSGALFDSEPFASAPLDFRKLRQITFSGDGEPTASPVFEQAVAVAVKVRAELAPLDTRLVLITDSACFERSGVQAGLRILQSVPHQIWAKLDAGTDAYYRLVNRSQVPFDRILRNLETTSKQFPLIIQSLFMNIRGIGPSTSEIDAYCDRLDVMRRGGGQIHGLQLNTIARRPPEDWATALTTEQLERVAVRIKSRTGLPQQLAFANAYQISRQAIRATENPKS
jgi:wyosine [tRNA(Phe)-imidazoG37] synthetase (radical SAM superfamily)